MRNAISKTEKAIFTPSVALSTIWDVCADSRYSVKKYIVPSDLLIAIRTVEGCGILKLDNSETFALTAGSLIIVKLSSIKSYKTKNNIWNFKWLEFNAPQYIIPAVNTVYSIKLTEFELLCISNCFHLLNLGTPEACTSASAIFCSLIFNWLNAINYGQNSPDTQLFVKISEYININISASLHISYIAKKFSISERTLRNLFIKHCKMSPKQYIEQKKLSLAMDYLNNSYMQIKEVAAITGFSNQYYFSRAFKKHFGKPPSAFMNID